MVLVPRAEILRRALRLTRRLRQLTYGRAKALQRLVIPCALRAKRSAVKFLMHAPPKP